ncbi:PREDICTED: kielin/chordin-like protein [Dinoponera quadriceps]|uniref:Kielin/chordin-like protein n=1 Tax=Dinoponera quadriceps TaxID=609295 RepID=A0A6P3X5M6_DINQU|nr:PREDICTED: kielin/chordin-like protein [Dinoponera quadriceps]
MTRRAPLIQILVCVTLAVAIVAADQEKCNKTKCPGPLKYYDLLDCKPVYDKEDDCCATRYNCDHLDGRATDKCYVNGKEYAVGENLKDEDANPCDMACVCRMDYEGHASFSCAVVDCFGPPPKLGCYKRKSPLRCCDGEEICPENPEDRATCVVDGKTYKDGEYFTVEDEPDTTCICQPGYEGKNVEPFCAKPKRPYCSPDFRDAYSVRQHCAPVYYSNQSPQTDCNLSTRCQNANDTVIHNGDNLKSAETSDEKNVCLFGDMKMHLGDELNQATDYNSVCVKCVCEVPPTVTCQRLPDEECDVTKHPPFNN